MTAREARPEEAPPLDDRDAPPEIISRLDADLRDHVPGRHAPVLEALPAGLDLAPRRRPNGVKPAEWAQEVPLTTEVQPDEVVLARMIQDPARAGRRFAEELLALEFPRLETRGTFARLLGVLAGHQAGVTTYAVQTALRAAIPAGAHHGHQRLERVLSLGATYWQDDDGQELSPRDHIRLFREWSARVRLFRLVDSVKERAAEDSSTAERLEAMLHNGLAAYAAGTREDRVFDDAEAQGRAALEYLTPGALGGLEYGFQALDAAVLPFQVGQFLVIGGTSGSGKSTVLRNMARALVLRDEFVPVAGLTIEMSGGEWRAALACMDQGVDVERLIREQLTDDEKAAYRRGVQGFVDCPHFILNERGRVTPADVMRYVERYRAIFADKFPGVAPVLFVDHLHRVDYGAVDEGTGLGALARDLKSFAKDMECRVIALAQYTKMEAHQVPDDRNLRQTNVILEEADKILHIYRPKVAVMRYAHGPGYEVLVNEQTGAPYYEADAPEDAFMAPDPTHVYVKLGKMRAKVRHAIVRVPFNAETGLMYDTAPLAAVQDRLPY